MLIKSTARSSHHITDKKQCKLNYCKQLFIFTNTRHHYQKSHYFQQQIILIWHKNCNSLMGINYFFAATMIHGTLLKLICCTCTNTGSAKESFASQLSIGLSVLQLLQHCQFQPCQKIERHCMFVNSFQLNHGFTNFINLLNFHTDIHVTKL